MYNTPYIQSKYEEYSIGLTVNKGLLFTFILNIKNFPHNISVLQNTPMTMNNVMHVALACSFSKDP